MVDQVSATRPMDGVSPTQGSNPRAEASADTAFNAIMSKQGSAAAPGGAGSGALSGSLLDDIKQLSADLKGGDTAAVSKDISKLLADLKGGSDGGSPAGSAASHAASSPASGDPASAAPSSASPDGGSKGGMGDLMSMLEKLLKDLKSGDKSAADADLKQLMSMLGGGGQAGGREAGGASGAGPGGSAPGGSAPSASQGTQAGGQPDMENTVKTIVLLLEDLKSGNTQGVQKDLQGLSEMLQKSPQPATV
jgi:hypothetical protein